MPYLILLIAVYFFHHKFIESHNSFPVDTMPSHLTPIFYSVVIFMGLAGLFAVVGDYWSSYAWLLYLFTNLLIALYVFLYQLVSIPSLFIAMLISILLSFILEWLFIETGQFDDLSINIITRNLVGAVEAWAILYALLTTGQFFVYSVGIHKKFQFICFFLVGIALILLIAVWNSMFHCKGVEVIGFVVMGIIIICSIASRNYN
jgi:hypothetical protein